MTYPCCECCLTDALHPDHHEIPCPTCNNPTADRLRAELAHMAEARDNARAEVERLTARMESVEAGRETEQTMIRNAVAQLATVREWIDRRGVDVSDRDGAYWDGYRAAQRHALQDAAELRAALDGEGDRD